MNSLRQETFIEQKTEHSQIEREREREKTNKLTGQFQNGTILKHSGSNEVSSKGKDITHWIHLKARTLLKKGTQRTQRI